MFDDDSSLNYQTEESLNEAGKSEKKYYIRGVFSTIGEKNRNGRIYPKELWDREVQEYQKQLQEGTINTLMEVEHPPRSNVDPMLAVAKIQALSIEGNKVMGEAVMLDNDRANQLKTLIDNGIKISVSSRGCGSVSNSKVTEFKLITYDIVANPSDFNATMNGVCESLEGTYSMNEGVVVDKEFVINSRGQLVPRDELSKTVVDKAQQTSFDNMNANGDRDENKADEFLIQDCDVLSFSNTEVRGAVENRFTKFMEELNKVSTDDILAKAKATEEIIREKLPFETFSRRVHSMRIRLSGINGLYNTAYNDPYAKLNKEVLDSINLLDVYETLVKKSKFRKSTIDNLDYIRVVHLKDFSVEYK